MKLSHLYNRIVAFGIDKDPRKNKTAILAYADSAVLWGKSDTQVKKVLVGIDIEASEILLADSIRARQGLDLVISHHPEGKAYAALADVMRLQVDILIKAGIPKSVAGELLEERQREVARRISPANHMRAVDAAKLLNIPFMCVHTPADNQVSSFIQGVLQKAKPKKVQDVIDILGKIPEYKIASANSAGPRIILGNPKRPVGKILVEMTGGTEGNKDVYDKLYRAGVRTLVSMHLSEEHFKKVKDANLNVVVAGHISSDNLGLNLILDRIEREEKLSIMECSGFRRVSRNKGA